MILTAVLDRSGYSLKLKDDGYKLRAKITVGGGDLAFKVSLSMIEESVVKITFIRYERIEGIALEFYGAIREMTELIRVLDL